MNKKGTNNVPGKPQKPRAGRQSPKKARRKPGIVSPRSQALLAGLLGAGGGGPMGGPMGPMI